MTAAVLVFAALAQLFGTIAEREFNTAAGIGVAAAPVGLAGLAATDRWWALALVAVISGLLTVAAISQLSTMVSDDDTGGLLRVLAFQALTLTAAIAGTVASVRARRSRPTIHQGRPLE